MKKSDWFLTVANIYVAATIVIGQSIVWASVLAVLHMLAGLHIKHMENKRENKND